jgi:hypothetical protein
MYVLLDTDLNELTFHRVPYDHEALRQPFGQPGCLLFLLTGWVSAVELIGGDNRDARI